jgi:hypothetical protein
MNRETGKRYRFKISNSQAFSRRALTCDLFFCKGGGHNRSRGKILPLILENTRVGKILPLILENTRVFDRSLPSPVQGVTRQEEISYKRIKRIYVLSFRRINNL